MPDSTLERRTRTYLVNHGWSVTGAPNWERWTREEFKGWWRKPGPEGEDPATHTDRHVSFEIAIREQIEHEKGNGIW